jgi:hypothetical protein
MPTSLPEATMLLGRGFRMLAYGGDLWLYRAALRDGLTQLRAATNGQRAKSGPHATTTSTPR